LHSPDFDPALVQALGAEGLQKLQIAASVCPAAVVHDHGKLRVVCRACPPFEASSGPDGTVALDPPRGDGLYELESVQLGAFTKPGAVEAAAVFAGCEPHSGNGGGTLLVSRSDQVWIQKSYRSGFHPAHCQAFRRADARDILVCLWETDHQSSAHWMLDSYDFLLGDDEHPEHGWWNLLTVDDDSVSECWGDQPRVTADAITDFRVTAPGPGQAPGLVVSLRLARGAKTAAYRARCKALEKPDGPPVNAAAVLPAVSKQLILLWDGATFMLSVVPCGMQPNECSKCADPMPNRCSGPELSPSIQQSALHGPKREQDLASGALPRGPAPQ
jgi:hypothetical protein